MEDLDIYDDLEEFREVQEKKSKELEAWENKYNESLQTIESQKSELKDLKKKIKTIEVNFQNLLDTARAELNRKDKQLAALRKEKDDICFRRKLPAKYTPQQPQQAPQEAHIDKEYPSGSDFVAAKTHELAEQPRVVPEEVFPNSSNPFSSNPFSENTRSRTRDCSREQHPVRRDSRSRHRRNNSETDRSSPERGRYERNNLSRRVVGNNLRRSDYRRDSHEEKDYGRSERNNSSKDNTIERNNERLRTEDRSDKSTSKERNFKPRVETDDNIEIEKVRHNDEGNSFLKERRDEHHRTPKTENNKNYHEIHTDMKSENDDTNLKKDKESNENRASTNLSKDQTVQSDKEKHNSSDSSKKETVQNKDHTKEGHIRSKTDRDVDKSFETPKQLVEINATDKECSAMSSNNITTKARESPKTTESVSTHPVEAKPELSNSITKPVKANCDTKITSKIPSAQGSCKTFNQESDENSNYDQVLKLTTPKKVSLFNALFGRTPPSSSESGRTTVSDKLLTNVMQLLNSNDSKTTSPSVYTDDSDVEQNKKLLSTVVKIAKTKEQSITSEEIDGCFTANVDLIKKSGSQKNEIVTKTDGCLIDNANNVENEETLNLVEKSYLQENAINKDKSVTKTENIFSSLSAIFGNSDAQIIPALGDLKVVEDDTIKENVLPMSYTLKKPKIKSFADNAEVIEIEDDTDVEITDEEERRITCDDSEKKLAVPSTEQVPANQNTTELVDSSDEHLKPTQSKNKKEHIEIIENIRLPSLFELQKQKENVCIANDNLNVHVETVVEEITKLTDVGIKEFVADEPKNDGDLNVIDTIDITDDNDGRLVDDNGTEMNVEDNTDDNVLEAKEEQNSTKKVVRETLAILKTSEKTNEQVKSVSNGTNLNNQLKDSAAVETIAKTVKQLQSNTELEEPKALKVVKEDTKVVTTDTETKEKLTESTKINKNKTSKDLSDIKKNQEPLSKLDEIVPAVPQNSLLDISSSDLTESKAMTSAVTDSKINLPESILDDTTGISNVTQTNLEQQVTIIKETQIIEKDGIIFELATTAEVVEQLTLLTEEILFEVEEEADVADQPQKRENEGFCKIELEMAKMHSMPKNKNNEDGMIKKAVKSTTNSNELQSKSIIPEKFPIDDHTKDDDTETLSAVIIVIEDDSQEVGELVNTIDTINKPSITKSSNSSLQYEVVEEDIQIVTQATNDCLTESESELEEITTSQPETEDEINSALTQLRELQNRSASRCKFSQIETANCKKQKAEDVVAFVVKNCPTESKQNIPSVAISKTPQNTNAAVKVEKTINRTMKEKPKVSTESIKNPIKVVATKLKKCKVTETNTNQNKAKKKLPQLIKKEPKKIEIDRLSKLKRTALTPRLVRPVMKAAPHIQQDVIKVKNVMAQYKIPKKNTKQQFSVDTDQSALNKTRKLTNFKSRVTIENPKVSSNIVEENAKRFQQLKSQETNSTICANSELFISKIDRSVKSTEFLVDTEAQTTLENLTKPSVIEEVTKRFQEPNSKEEDNKIDYTANAVKSVTANNKREPKKAYIKTEINTHTGNILQASIATFSPTHSLASSDDFSTQKNQLKKTKKTNLKRRILDTSSDEEIEKGTINVTKKILSQNKVATPKRKLKRKRMCQSAEIYENTKKELKTTGAIQSVSKKPKLSLTANISPMSEAVAIFHTESEIPTCALLPAMSPANTSQDAQFKEIDSRLQSMFQSPPYKSDYVSGAAEDTFSSTIGVSDATQTNLIVEETIANDSKLELNDTTLPSTKRLSLGTSEYLFEKVSENVVNISITRKRGKKRKTALTTTLQKETPMA